MSRLARGAGLGIVLLLAACSSASGTPVATSHVDLPKSYLFSPAEISVSAGTTVTWSNSDNFTHSVELTQNNHLVGIMHPGESVSFKFSKPGTYHYICTFHPQNMSGDIIVH